MIPESKLCTKCGTEKPSSDFSTRLDKGYVYLKPYCKNCTLKYNHELRKKKRQEELSKREVPLCKICNTPIPVTRSIYCSNKCKSKLQSNANYKNQQSRGKIRKQAMIDKMGGKCSLCGYSKCLGALEFHHVDPSTKEFGLDCRRFSNTSQEKLDIEAAKCIIVCSNCHAEIHWYKDDEK